MAIIAKRNQAFVSADGDGNALWWDFVQDLIANGWRVLGSGDGDSYENSGDTAGTTGTGAGGGFDLFAERPGPIADVVGPNTVASLGREGEWRNVAVTDALGGCWWRLASPAAAEHYCEFLFQLYYGSGTQDEGLIVRYCRGDQRFDDGASAWERPGVNTGTALALGTANPVDTGSNARAYFLPSGNGHAHWVVGDETVDWDFIFWVGRDAGAVAGEVFSLFGRLRLVGGQQRSDLSADPDPYVLLTAFEEAAGTTEHNLTGTDFFRLDDDATGTAERLEDRSAYGGSTYNRAIASFGLDDDGVSAELAGHYGVCIWAPSHRTAFGSESIYGFGTFGPNRANGNTMVDTVIPWGRGGSDAETQFHFFKGVTKNDLVGLASRPSTFPQVERPGDEEEDPFRVVWGLFSLYWGAEERVLGFPGYC